MVTAVQYGLNVVELGVWMQLIVVTAAHFKLNIVQFGV